ncbi:MAG: GNAT family protein [Nanoarchaeota archaeon]|nr:GNAT family N-acetyltransferase [Nanoarchaeota archaeon]MBU1031261.1 GNAT family N-acetyltransferase [Nanoarchaeota archaeon]MBU1849602.1 GNAT family N-acetyltransferase [Nanoarchaeota archaeon]
MKEDIFLRKIELKDAKIISQWFNDKNNISYMSTYVRCHKHSKKSVENEIKKHDDSEKVYVVCLKNSEEVIGNAGIEDIDYHDKRGEIFFLIGKKECHGKGYGTIIAQLLLDIAFKEMGLNSLFATATAENIASIKTLERVGFKKIGVRREYNYINGKFMDEVLFDIIRKDYNDSNSS